jgi:hypothetical protein
MKPLSPENYIRQRVRSLPIHECLINKDWKQGGEASIMVSRKHSNGNYTYGIYLVDLYCQGIKDTFYNFNKSESDYLSDVNLILEGAGGGEKVEYALVHNIIYEALAYAAEYEFRPHKDFDKVSKFILEDDTEEIDLIEIECGWNGKPCLVVSKDEDFSGLVKQLERTAGHGNFEILYDGGEMPDMDLTGEKEQPGEAEMLLEEMATWDEKEWKDFNSGKRKLSEESSKALNQLIFNISFSIEEFKAAEHEAVMMFNCRIEDTDYEELDAYQEFTRPEEIQNYVGMAISAFSQSKSKYSYKIIKELIRQHPGNPHLHNILASMYRLDGKTKESRELFIYSYQRFPRYLFILAGYLEYLLDKDKILEIEKILGGKEAIYQYFPERRSFASTEILRYYRVLILYFARSGRLLQADRIFEKLKRLIPDDQYENIAGLENYLVDLKSDYLLRLFNNKTKLDEFKKRITKSTDQKP